MAPPTQPGVFFYDGRARFRAPRRKWSPTEAALLRLLRVKYRLLGLRPCDQNVDPSDHSLIGAPRRDAEVMRDLAIEFDALVTHY
jgi:hypothetical protein